jgi:adenylate kinase family enzyme
VVGNSGSGKSTLATRLAAAIGVPHLELDSVFHQPDWTPLRTDEFRQAIGAAVAGDCWVMDGNYSAVRPLIWARADTVVWLDLPRRTVMRQGRLADAAQGRYPRGTVERQPRAVEQLPEVGP